MLVCKSIKDCALPFIGAPPNAVSANIAPLRSSCVVCADALKFCSASWLNLRRLTGIASSAIGAQLFYVCRCFKFTAAKRVKFYSFDVALNFADRACAESL